MRFIVIVLFVLSSLAMNAQTQSDPIKVRCESLTTKNVQCKNKATEGTTFCGIHDPNAPRCGANTTKNKPCRMKVSKTGDRCSKHVE